MKFAGANSAFVWLQYLALVFHFLALTCFSFSIQHALALVFNFSHNLYNRNSWLMVISVCKLYKLTSKACNRHAFDVKVKIFWRPKNSNLKLRALSTKPPDYVTSVWVVSVLLFNQYNNISSCISLFCGTNFFSNNKITKNLIIIFMLLNVHWFKNYEVSIQFWKWNQH